MVKKPQSEIDPRDLSAHLVADSIFDKTSRRRRNFYFSFFCVIGIAGILGIIVRDVFFSTGYYYIYLGLCISLILLASGFLLFVYLQTSGPKNYHLQSGEPGIVFTRSAGRRFEFDSEHNELVDNTPIQLPFEYKAANTLDEKARIQVENHYKISIVERDYRVVLQRITTEIQRLTRSANVNLVFGSLTTIGGIAVLVANAFQAPTTVDWTHIASHYIPKVSITIFIEIFAFFFLKIYRTALTDIKYFHNERTNIEQKIIALKVAVLTGNESVIESVVEKLAQTERNFVLKKGESTTELEKVKLENVSEKGLFETFKALLKIKGEG